MPSEPYLDRFVGYITAKEPTYVQYHDNLDTFKDIPLFVCDVLALHDAGVHLFLNDGAVRRFRYTSKAANDYLVPFTKIPSKTEFLQHDGHCYLPGVKGMPGRMDCDGLIKTAGIACVYGMLLCPRQATQALGLSLPYGDADANIERCAALVRLYCAGEIKKLQCRGASLITLAQRLNPRPVKTENSTKVAPELATNFMEGVAASIAAFEEKISKLTRHLPRRFEDGSLAFSA